MSFLGRIRQTYWVVQAWVGPIDDAMAAQHLTAAEYALYCQMPRSARQHHLRVLSELLARGQQHPALLRAALLHDVGKLRYRFSLPHKILVVLVKHFAPQTFARWGESPPQGWRTPFVVSAQHPAWGAEMAAAVGADPLSVALIRRHQDKLDAPPQTEAEHLLLALQAADDRS